MLAALISAASAARRERSRLLRLSSRVASSRSAPGQGRAEADRRCGERWSSSSSSSSVPSPPPPSSLESALAEAWEAAAASIVEDAPSSSSELDRAIRVLEEELLWRKRGRTDEDDGGGETSSSSFEAASSVAEAAAFEAVSLFRLWRCSGSGIAGSQAASSELALAERAAARAVALSRRNGGANEETATAAAVRRLCSLRHAASLAACGRLSEASEALAGLEGGGGGSVPTPSHSREETFYRELLSLSLSGSTSPSSLAEALSSLGDYGDEGEGGASAVFAPRLRASALFALRSSLESLLADGDLSAARRLAEAEAEAHEAARGKRKATREASAVAKKSASKPASPGEDESAAAAAHARYRLATIAFAAGHEDAQVLARAALEVSAGLWGDGDDRTLLRRHRLAAAALADRLLGAPPPSPPPTTARLSLSDIEAEAAASLRRFEKRLGGGSGLAGEARLVSSAARLLTLRESSGDASARPTTGPLAAFEAVLSPRKRADALAEVKRGLREMERGCPGGDKHPLVARAREVAEAVERVED